MEKRNVLLFFWTRCISVTTRVRSKLKVQNSSTFQRLSKDPICIFQAPKLSTKSHILDADIQNLDCNVTLKQAKWNQILFPSTGDMHTSACFKTVNKCNISKFARCKFKDFSRIFKYFQAPYPFSSTFKGLEVFIPDSSIFKEFPSTLWTLNNRLATSITNSQWRDAV